MTADMSAAAIAKEIRALLPVWVVSGLVLTADATFGPMKLIPLGPLAYAIGVVALGAQSIGHEYAHGTLALLLAQPVNRRRILLIKYAVLAVMILSLLAVAEAELLSDAVNRGSLRDQFILIVIPTLCGLFVAPWLTMMTRGALAGAVFSVSIPGSMLVIGELIGVAIFGAASTDTDAFKFALWTRGMLVLCALGAVLGWRTFLRLQVIDGGGPELALPRLVRGHARAERHHPLWMLAKKELHLQQLSFVIAGLYLIGWATVAIGLYWQAEYRAVLFAPLTVIYVSLVSVLIGSLASAEERQLGTLEWQMLLPIPRWQQWAIKVGVAFAAAALLGVGLGVGLPFALMQRFPRASGLIAIRGWWLFVPLMAVITASSLYVSSMCRSGVRALVLSLPVAVTVVLFIQALTTTLMRMLSDTDLSRRVHALSGVSWAIVTSSIEAGLVGLLLWFAFLNHQSADQSARRAAVQIASLAAVVTLGIALSFIR